MRRPVGLPKKTAMAGMMAVSLGVFAPASAQESDEGSGTGMIEFNNACRTCHTWKEGDNRLGPNLYNIVGRKVAAAEGFSYSAALGQSDFTWTEENLDKFIADPDGFLPGNKMQPYGGIDDAEQRKKIIEFLKTR